jgi:hypothetical protein
LNNEGGGDGDDSASASSEASSGSAAAVDKMKIEAAEQATLVDCPEYLVHVPTLVSRARSEFELELVSTANFHDFFLSAVQDPQNAELLGRFLPQFREPATRNTPAISNDEWECIGLYRVAIFRKFGVHPRNSGYERLDSRRVQPVANEAVIRLVSTR